MPIAVGSLKRGHFAPANDAYTSLLAFSFRNLFNFALLLGTSIYWKRDAETHRRLALLAVVALFSDPAIGRLPISSPLMLLLLFIAFHIAGPVYDLVGRRRIHRVYWLDVPYMLVMVAMAVIVAQSRAWHAIADWLMR